jgi:putative tricarboxylic transport membrane protein
LKNLDKWSALFFLGLGLAVLAHGIRLRLTVEHDVGPGLLPFVVGGILILLSMILLFGSVMGEEATEPTRSFWSNPHGWKFVFLTLFAAALFPVCLNYLGFILSIFLFLFFLFTFIARLKWWVAGIGGVSTALVAYLIFELWLKANLPRGVFGF